MSYVDDNLKWAMQRAAGQRKERAFPYDEIPPGDDSLLPPVELVRAQYRQHYADVWQRENRRGRYAAMSQAEWEAEIDRYDAACAAARKAGRPEFVPRFDVYGQREWKAGGPKPVYAQLASEYGLNHLYTKIER